MDGAGKRLLHLHHHLAARRQNRTAATRIHVVRATLLSSSLDQHGIFSTEPLIPFISFPEQKDFFYPVYSPSSSGDRAHAGGYLTSVSFLTYSSSAVRRHNVGRSSHPPVQAGKKPKTRYCLLTLPKRQSVLENKCLAIVRTMEERTENEQDQINRTII